ncbi:hypothetical protein AUJ84_00200 [Candidatus Pacearchaeota archaeon CG1_02_32_132]|nr:MAG: hypothetical protein AUJ84_00200 [Candidatus Pacearchaeota archaeon CG1_02_32_132]
MRFILDTNVLISALIKDSVTREILAKSGFEFYYPEISLEEITKHKELILEKSDMTKDEYSELLRKILTYVSLIGQDKINSKLEEAKEIFSHVDSDDVIFIVATLSIENDGIWSEDKHFKSQYKIKVYTTKELMDFLKNNFL